MAEFNKYQHVERYGTSQVQGIDKGKCYIFPKLDGTNASVWFKDVNNIGVGSRKRELSLDADNAGFFNEIIKDTNIKQFLYDRPHLRLYGEFLVPHSLKTYQEDAWRKFYIFDVVDTITGRYLAYDEYQPLLEQYGLTYIPCIAILEDPTLEELSKLLETNTYLVTEGVGEGIVIKRYDFVNQWGHTKWAKIVNVEFKVKAKQKVRSDLKATIETLEAKIAEKFVTEALVEKEYAKIALDEDGWQSRKIPELLCTVYYCLITEEMWEIVKYCKRPTIDFKRLYSTVCARVRQVKPELF